jgi:uncharacterized membrane protein YfcA
MGAAISAFLHNRVRNFIKEAAVLVSFGSALAAFITPFFVVKIQSEIIEIIFASVLSLVAIRLFFENRIKRIYFSPKPVSRKFYTVLGLVVGSFSAITGLGGGIIYVPALIYLFHIDTKISVGTSAIIVSITMICSAAAYLMLTSDVESISGTFGYVVFQAALPLGFGAIFGAFTGVKFAVKSSAKLLRNVFAILLIVAIARIIFKL